jgi:hypothetical protein
VDIKNVMLRTSFAVAFLASACVPRLIPGTEIEDNDDNQRILSLVEQYRRDAESRNADALSMLVSPGFYDDSGTPETTDDLDQASLKTRLSKEWKSRIKTVRLDLQVKRISVEGDTARVRYFYTLRYQIGENWKQEIDTKEMLLRRESGLWKIMSGV